MKTILTHLKTISCIAFILMLSSSISYSAPNWQQQRYGAVGFSIGDKGYIGTGYGYIKNVYGLKKDFWEYNPATDSWTQKADFGGAARYFAVGFSIGNKGYIGTGGNNTTGSLNDFWEYSPVLNKWTKKSDIYRLGRTCAIGFCIGNKGYIGTGYRYENGVKFHLQDFWEYDPVTETWIQVSNFPGGARYAAVGFSIGSKGYVGTGLYYMASNDMSWFNDFYEYDPGTGNWTQKAAFSGAARGFAVGFSIGTKGYIGTGNAGGYSKDFWEYDLTNDIWVKKSDIEGDVRDCAVGFGIGLKGYIGTGLTTNSAFLQDFWEFNQSTNKWTRKADLGSKHKAETVEAVPFTEVSQAGEVEIMVYPNPSNSMFNFKLEAQSEDLI